MGMKTQTLDAPRLALQSRVSPEMLEQAVSPAVIVIHMVNGMREKFAAEGVPEERLRLSVRFLPETRTESGWMLPAAIQFDMRSYG